MSPCGDVKLGAVIGSTDEIGAKAVDVAHPIRDIHVTLLRLLELDNNKLTCLHAGCFKQLSRFGREVNPEFIALGRGAGPQSASPLGGW